MITCLVTSHRSLCRYVAAQCGRYVCVPGRIILIIQVLDFLYYGLSILHYIIIIIINVTLAPLQKRNSIAEEEEIGSPDHCGTGALILDPRLLVTPHRGVGCVREIQGISNTLITF